MTSQNLFRWLHGLWALPCIIASVWLAMATEGHPPGIIFVPFVLVVWGIGHLALWGAHKLARRGLSKGPRPSGRLPLPVVTVLVGSSIVTLLGIIFVVTVLPRRETWTVPTLMTLAAILAHVPALIGLLLRSDWSRLYSAALAAGWSLLMLAQMVETLWRGGSARPWEWPVATAIVLACGWLALQLSTNSAVAAYFVITPSRHLPGDTDGR